MQFEFEFMPDGDMRIAIDGDVYVTCINQVRHVWHLQRGTLITARSPSPAINAAEQFFHHQDPDAAAELAAWIIDYAFPDWIDPCIMSDEAG